MRDEHANHEVGPVERIFDEEFRPGVCPILPETLSGAKEVWSGSNAPLYEWDEAAADEVNEATYEEAWPVDPMTVLFDVLVARGVPVRLQEDQHPEDPPTLVHLERTIPHISIGFVGEAMAVGGGAAVLHCRVEIYSYANRVYDGAHLVRLWDDEVLAYLPMERLGPLVQEKMEAFGEEIAQAFLRDNPPA